MKTLKKIFFLTCMALLLGITIIPASTHGQTLVGHWTFNSGSELVDLTGNFSNLTLKGSATVSDGVLDVGPNAWAQAIGYTGPVITEKTMVSWVRLDALSIPGFGDFSGGSALTIDKTDVDEFDAIVFGERQANRWEAGSTVFKRTNTPAPGFAETTTGSLVKMAITYQNIGGTARIKIYRNDILIGSYDKGPIASWSGSTTEILFGLRHMFPNGTLPKRPWLDAHIEEARIYNGVLTQEQIIALKVTPAQTQPPTVSAPFPCIDADGNSYNTVKIGDQVWMAQNLRTTTCSDGTPIPLVNDKNEWVKQNSAAYTWSSYLKNEQAREKYGALYNAYAAMEPCNICPDGWRVPSQADFQKLLDYLNPGAHLKLIDPKYWSGSRGTPTNSSGWTALPAGGKGGDKPGSYDFGNWAYFWSTTERNAGGNYLFIIHPNDAGAKGLAGKRYGFSIRCIKND